MKFHYTWYSLCPLFQYVSPWFCVSVRLPGSLFCFSVALCEYGAALEGYMEAAALSTSHFHDPVPEEVWPANILRRLINCCQRLNYHTQAAILCQLLQPVDYDLAFRILRENATTLLENMFGYFWDMTIIEYLICILQIMCSDDGGWCKYIVVPWKTAVCVSLVPLPSKDQFPPKDSLSVKYYT